MFRKIFSVLLLAGLISGAALAQESKPASAPTGRAKKSKIAAAMKWTDERATPIVVRGKQAVYGGEPVLERYTSLTAIAGEPEAFADKDVKVRGRILAICPTKGCWLRMREGREELFVRFKDYGFFAPRHLAGHDIELEGPVRLKITSAEMRRHYAEEQGKSKEEIESIKEDAIELNMEAYSMVISEPAEPQWEDELAKPLTVGKDRAIYGGEPALETATPIAAILADPAAFAGKTVRVDALIDSICATKGCWLNATQDKQTIFVTFKGYGFFVPRGLAGHRLTVEGIPTVSRMSEADRRHMAEDAGKSPEDIAKITGDADVLTLVAHAVAIFKR